MSIDWRTAPPPRTRRPFVGSMLQIKERNRQLLVKIVKPEWLIQSWRGELWHVEIGSNRDGWYTLCGRRFEEVSDRERVKRPHEIVWLCTTCRGKTVRGE